MSKLPTDRSLGPGVKPEVRKRYVHMLREDQDTWTAFLQSEWNLFDEVWYDVHVGRPMDLPKDSPNYMRAVVEGVSRKRIDVVGRIGTRISIIEVKPFANMVAIGQVVTYTDLFKREFTKYELVQPTIIAKTCDADILDIANEQNVMIIALQGVLL